MVIGAVSELEQPDVNAPKAAKLKTAAWKKRVMVGDALVFEHERLQQRINQFFDKVEAALKQCLRESSAGDVQRRASVCMAFIGGRLQRYVRTGFKRLPSERLDQSLSLLLG